MIRQWNVRLGLCLPVLALLGLAGCEDHHRGGDRYSYYDKSYGYPYGGYYGGRYAYPYGGYDRGWRGRDWDERKRYDRDYDNRDRYARDEWKEKKYKRKLNNGRPGDAERYNDRLCRNGIPGDAPADCD